MRSVVVPIAGIVAAALLDNRLSWGTVASVLVALYCHRLYRRTTAPTASDVSFAPRDEDLRPGWAARWLPLCGAGRGCQLGSEERAERVRRCAR